MAALENRLRKIANGTAGLWIPAWWTIILGSIFFTFYYTLEFLYS